MEVAMDKILRINMGHKDGPRATKEPVGDYAGLAGRALTSAIIAKEVPPLCHPLGKSNKLIIAPGMLSGSHAAQSGRVSVGCKSPLTGGIKEANAGGQGAQVLARLGYAAIVLEGKPKDDTLYKVVINKDRVEIIPDTSLKMLGNYDLIDKINSEYGSSVACISIGPAGEMKLAAATVAFTDTEQRPTRHAGRGGVGAVMGAKGVKVIVLNDDGMPMRSPKDPKKFKAANQAFVQGLKKHPITGQGLPSFGTNILTRLINDANALPTHNFQTGCFDRADNISGETQSEIMKSRGGTVGKGCHKGCVIRCSGIYNDKDGNYLTKRTEYETVWAHGANCGIDDMDVIAILDRMDDDYGLDTIEMGATIGMAMEAGLANFGDGQAAINLLKEVGNGTPLGRILGNGAAVTGKVFGIERVPAVKGQALPAYDPRSVQGIGVTYATSTMGADHTAGYAITANVLGVGGTVDPLKPEGQVELSRNLQIATAAIDATGLCLFIAFAILDQEDTFNAMLDMLGAFTGQNLTADDVVALGKKILDYERDFNTRAGFTSSHDRLPDFFKNEPLPSLNITFGVNDQDLDQVFNW
jgi:aldehyde:ferredoxin oxidoreductase